MEAVADLTMEETGAETTEPIQWSAKMLESFAQAKRGEIYPVDIDNFWDV